MYENVIESCRYLLKNYPAAQDCRDYIDCRLNYESQESFKFGYFPTIDEIVALTSLVDEEYLTEHKLFYKKVISDSLSPREYKYSYFDNYPLVMPFRDAYGRIVAIVGRTLLSDEDRNKKSISKYKNTVFKKGNYLFGLFEAKKEIVRQNCVYIVEGQIDVIKSIECGFNNVVALGSASMSAYQFSVINRYTNNIFLLLDNDEAGEKGRQSILSKFGRFANIKNFYLPESYKDIDDFFKENTLDDLSLTIKA